jgi:exodeoxyribonuclease VII small subunit
MSKQSFESALKRLEEIVGLLESGELSLEESIKMYEEGIGLSTFCTEKLNESEGKIKMLLREGDEFKLGTTEL